MTDRRTCPQCDGEGFIDDGSCVCGCVEDTCCCLEPEPPDCRVCGGRGYIPLGDEQDIARTALSAQGEKT